jgi:hypothetical protein
MKPLSWIAAIAAVGSVQAMAADTPAPNPRFYNNLDSQFSVRLPPGLLACISEETNHGVVILLDPSVKCNDEYEKSRAIFVYASSNVAVEATTAKQLASVECRWRHPREIAWLTARVSGRNAAGCQRVLPDGRIDVMFVVLRKTEAWPARWIEVGADLITDTVHHAADMGIFRRVLRGIWVHPDGPLR